MKRTLFTFVLVLAFICAAMAANFWNKKPYMQWSRGDAIQLLTDSPWASTTVLKEAFALPRTINSPQGAEDSRTQPMIRYVVSVTSALPIREAKVRMAALDQKYDKLDAATKQQLDQRWAEYLKAPNPGQIVITVDYGSNEPNLDRELVTYFQAQTFETMKPITSMRFDGGERIEPVAFSAQPHEFQVAFPRPSNGAPNSSFAIDFRHPNITGYAAQPVTAKFSLKDMIFGGGPAY
jgi:hypothetical protein